ncbi:MAG: hypothetical protein QNJ98_08180 [Planctomycetota bacterium]|nr:hypothetical protein [Planctomycetota bacterium]
MRFPRASFPAFVLASLAAFLVGCGGGGGGGGGAAAGPGVLTLPSIASMDGQVGILAPTFSTAAEPAVGDDASNNSTWGFFTFDLSAVPAGATIRSARIELWQRTTEGNAFQVVQLLVVDHMEVDGNGLQRIDLIANELEAPITNGGGQPLILSSNSNPGLRSMDVTRQIRNDLGAARRYSQYRIRGLGGQPLLDGQNDRVIFTDAENQRGGQPPRLVIELDR